MFWVGDLWCYTKFVNLKLLIPSMIFPLLTGFVGSYFTFTSINTWYQALNKPFFNPPNFLFGPVWTILYILMGISLYLILMSKSKKKDLAVKVFFIQLLLNLLWSFIFFSFQNPFLALLEIIALWIAIFMTIRLFLPISKTAGYLLIPYILWVSFALILNLSIVLLN